MTAIKIGSRLYPMNFHENVVQGYGTLGTATTLAKLFPLYRNHIVALGVSGSSQQC